MRILVLAALAAALPAFASPTCEVKPNERQLTAEEVQARLQQQGYDVRRVKREGSCFEVEAKRDGRRVKAHVSPVDAKVVSEKVKDAS
jgi:hypothetical protein